MKTEAMRTLSIEIGPDSYPRWPVPVVRRPVVPVLVAEETALGRRGQGWALGQMPGDENRSWPYAPCAHGVLIAAGALVCRSLPVLCRHALATTAIKL